MTGYRANHNRVEARRGKASAQTCACGAPARHWAHRHDTDPADPENYEAMCVPCHKRYDGAHGPTAPKSAEHRAKLSAALKGRPKTPDHRKKIADANRARAARTRKEQP